MQRAGDGHHRNRGDQQCVSIGIGLGHDITRNGTAAATAIVIKDVLSDALGEFVRYGARNHIGATTRRERYDPANGFGRICGFRTGRLTLRNCLRCQHQRDQSGNLNSFPHTQSPDDKHGLMVPGKPITTANPNCRVCNTMPWRSRLTPVRL